MARIMKRYGPASLNGGAIRTAITCPANKKLEALGWWIASQNVAITAANWIITPAAGGAQQGLTFEAWPANTFGRHAPFDAPVVLHVGDKLDVNLQPAGLVVLVMVTYVEVDE